MMFPDFTGLAGLKLRLDGLQESDRHALFQSLMSKTAWPVVERGIQDEASFHRYLDTFFVRQAASQALTLVGRTRDTGEVTSISTFWNLAPNGSKIEIGFTWVADRFMRTFVNTEQKLLMLTYAFEVVQVKRVEFSVAPKNQKSNAAMLRLGAKLEGTLRKWRFLSENDNGERNLYSIIDDEWPMIKKNLTERLARA